MRFYINFQGYCRTKHTKSPYECLFQCTWSKWTIQASSYTAIRALEILPLEPRPLSRLCIPETNRSWTRWCLFLTCIRCKRTPCTGFMGLFCSASIVVYSTRAILVKSSRLNRCGILKRNKTVEFINTSISLLLVAIAEQVLACARSKNMCTMIRCRRCRTHTNEWLVDTRCARNCESSCWFLRILFHNSKHIPPRSKEITINVNIWLSQNYLL